MSNPKLSGKMGTRRICGSGNDGGSWASTVYQRLALLQDNSVLVSVTTWGKLHYVIPDMLPTSIANQVADFQRISEDLGLGDQGRQSVIRVLCKRCRLQY